MDFTSKTALKHLQNRDLPPRKKKQKQNRDHLEQKETGIGPDEIGPINKGMLGDAVLPSLLERHSAKASSSINYH